MDCETTVHELHQGHRIHGLDLAIARGRSWGVLCLLGWAAACGIRTLNRRECIARVHNKADMAAALASAGVPTPAAYIGTPARLLESLGSSDLPLIVKPVFGDNGHGLRLVASREELEYLDPAQTVLAQRYVPNDSTDLKLYAIGEKTWAVRKPSPFSHSRRSWPPQPLEQQPEPELLPVTEAQARIVRMCRSLFGLELFGVDCIETAEGPLVIEVNEFPNYTAVPAANDLLADFVISHARQENQR